MPSFNDWQILSLPATPAAPSSIEWGLLDAIGASMSPFSYATQQHDWGVAKLRASLSYAAMDDTEAAPWEAFLMGLRGPLNVFQFGDPRREGPINPAAVAGVVAADNQKGFALQATSSGLQAGDWIQIGYRLYRVVGAIGGALTIWPNLRESPTAGTPLVITNTAGLFRLSKNDRSYHVEVGGQYFFTFEIEEAL
jgi:hypothetical protein